VHRWFAGGAPFANDSVAVIARWQGARLLHPRRRHLEQETAMENGTDDVAQRVGENFEALRARLGERTQELRDTISNFVEEQPLAAVGIAFGVGYLLSGALFSRTTFKAASVGSKFVFGGFLKQLLTGIGPGFVVAAMSGRGGEARTSQTKPQQSGSGNGNKH
jgi:ElaB/YqjD/DUF883 family membrane-anchored ribosome-binding protein